MKIWNHKKDPTDPLKWRKPRHVRVNLTGAETDAELDRLFAAMALSPAHTFEVLASAERLAEYLACNGCAKAKGGPMRDRMEVAAQKIQPKWSDADDYVHDCWPLPNVGIGATCRTQDEVDHAAPILLAMPNARPWLRIEPGERISLEDVPVGMFGPLRPHGGRSESNRFLHLIELSGQTVPTAKPLHPDYARLIRDECQAASVEFRFLSWGEWVPYDDDHWPARFARDDVRDRDHTKFVGDVEMYPAGPRRSGRVLDGVTHDGQIGGGK